MEKQEKEKEDEMRFIDYHVCALLYAINLFNILKNSLHRKCITTTFKFDFNNVPKRYLCSSSYDGGATPHNAWEVFL